MHELARHGPVTTIGDGAAGRFGAPNPAKERRLSVEDSVG